MRINHFQLNYQITNRDLLLDSVQLINIILIVCYDRVDEFSILSLPLCRLTQGNSI